MRNILALLGAGLLAGCCLMHFHVPITEQIQTTPEPSGASGSACCRRTRLRNGSLRPAMPERSYMEHYGEGEAGTAREREDGYALFWQTVMAAAPTYDHLASYDIHVRGRKRYEAIRVRSWRRAGRGPGSSLSGAARACFRTRTVTVCSACSRVFPNGVTRRQGFRLRRGLWATWGRRPQLARNFHKQSARRSRKETVCATVQKHRIL